VETSPGVGFEIGEQKNKWVFFVSCLEYQSFVFQFTRFGTSDIGHLVFALMTSMTKTILYVLCTVPVLLYTVQYRGAVDD
jgi:hypothetical protein